MEKKKNEVQQTEQPKRIVSRIPESEKLTSKPLFWIITIIVAIIVIGLAILFAWLLSNENASAENNPQEIIRFLVGYYYGYK